MSAITTAYQTGDGNVSSTGGVEVGVAGVGGDRRHILVGRGHVGIADGDGGGHHGFTILQASDGG